MAQEVLFRGLAFMVMAPKVPSNVTETSHDDANTCEVLGLFVEPHPTQGDTDGIVWVGGSFDPWHQKGKQVVSLCLKRY